MENKKLIIICAFGALTIIGSTFLATNNKSKLNYIQNESEKREKYHRRKSDSLIDRIHKQDLIISERDKDLQKRDKIITKMILDLKSDDKELKDSIKKTPLSQILNELRK